MTVLFDSNVLLRAVWPNHAQSQIALESLRIFQTRGDQIYVVPQVLYEFWVVSTRPSSSNGMGYGLAESIDEMQDIFHWADLLHDTPDVFTIWHQLIIRHAVLGKSTLR